MKQQLTQAEQSSKVTTEPKIPAPSPQKSVVEKIGEITKSRITEEAQAVKPDEPIAEETAEEPKKETLTYRLNPFTGGDIKKVLMILGILVIILAGITIISKKTTWTNAISNKIASWAKF